MSRIKRHRLALYLLTIATVIFRSELALLLASTCLHLLTKAPSMGARIRMIRTTLVPAIAAGAIAGLLISVSIDTFFWQFRRLLWPELAAFLSNVFPSKDSLGASAWGTSPWHWYFTSALPRLVNPVALLAIPYGLAIPAIRQPIIDLALPSLLYTILYSFLAHKETRFLYPIVPSLTLASALAATYITTHRRSILTNILLYTFIPVTLLTTFFSHALLLPLSSLTYPGAGALLSFHTTTLLHPPQPHLHVHLTNLALQTGVTRFLEPLPPFQRRPLITFPGSADGTRPTLQSASTGKIHYDKTSNSTLFLTPTFWSQFDYVIVESPELAIGAWDVADRIPSLGKPRLLHPNEGRGRLVLGKERERDGLMGLAEAMYGSLASRLYAVIHDVLREGWGTGGKSWTRGWWLHWGLETRLFVLKRAESGVYPNA